MEGRQPAPAAVATEEGTGMRHSGFQFGIFALFLLCTAAAARADLQVDRGPVEVQLEESGEVRALVSREITAPNEWRMDLQIVRLVEEGLVVAAGDTLVQFDATTVREQLDEALAQREQHEADLRRIEAEQGSRRLQMNNQVAHSRFAAEKAELQVSKLGFESEARREDVRLDLRKAQIALDEAQKKLVAQAVLDSLELAKARLRIAEAADRVKAEREQIDNMTLTAPIDGMVVHGEAGEDQRKVREGDTVRAGVAVVSLPDLTQMEAVFFVNEVDRERVRVGQAVEVGLDAFPELSLPGEVTHVARLALPPKRDSAVRGFEARVRIDGQDEWLKPGMTARLRVQITAAEDVLRIPRAALAHDAKGRAVVFPRSQWPKPRVVSVGRIHPLWAEALEGVSEDEELVPASEVSADFLPFAGKGIDDSQEQEAKE